MAFSCKEAIEGCRDVEATNYDVTADDPCPDDCCQYPQLKLEISNRFDTLIFSYDSIYNFAGHPTQFEKIVFYLSDFRLVNENDSLASINEITLDIIDGSIETFRDDIVLISPGRSFRQDIGEIRGGGATYSTLRFVVGLGGDLAIAEAESAPDDHPLALGIDTLWTYPDGYIFNQITVIPDTIDRETTRIINSRGGFTLVEISLDFTQSVSLGEDVTLPLRIDYQKWFSGIDFASDSAENIINLIVSNTTDAFSINE